MLNFRYADINDLDFLVELRISTKQVLSMVPVLHY